MKITTDTVIKIVGGSMLALILTVLVLGMFTMELRKKKQGDCEYIQYESAFGLLVSDGIVHAGDCSNPIHHKQ